MFFKILLHSYYIYGIYTYIRMIKVIKDVHVIYKLFQRSIYASSILVPNVLDIGMGEAIQLLIYFPTKEKE